MEKSKHKTQDMIQRHGNQIQQTTRQNQTQEHNKQESTVMTSKVLLFLLFNKIRDLSNEKGANLGSDFANFCL